MHKLATLTLAILLSACASYSGRGLVVSDSSYDEVIRAMGRLALEWTDAAGSRQLAYPRGSMGGIPIPCLQPSLMDASAS